MRKIGYARVSTAEQNLDRQIGAIKGADAVFHDEQWDAQIAIDVYNAIRKVMAKRS